MNLEGIKSVLVLAPHPDDGEFGAGGTLHHLAARGAEIQYVAFSPCIKSLPEGSDPDRLHKELKAASEVLGIGSSNVRMLDFPVRDFPEHRQHILEKMVLIRKEFKPDLVFVPNSHDFHQDHEVINKEGLRAFKHSCMLGYELPWNNLQKTSNFHFKLEEKDLDAKLNSLKCYTSQEGRNYLSEEFIKGLASVRGVQINARFAEAFECIRWISD
jgi:LmbE family N-acetylglucosaminyl deacetylase